MNYRLTPFFRSSRRRCVRSNRTVVQSKQSHQKVASCITGLLILCSFNAYAVERTTVNGSDCRALNAAEAGDLQISGSSIVNRAAASRTVVCDVVPAFQTQDSIYYDVQARATRDLGAMGDYFECSIAVSSPLNRDSGEIASNRVTSDGALSVAVTTLNRDGDASLQIKCALPEGARLNLLDIDQHPIQ